MTDGEIALLGSIPEHYPMIRRALCERLREKLPLARVISPRGTAALGAARLALQAFSPS